LTVFPVSGGAVWGWFSQRRTGVKACANIRSTRVDEVQCRDKRAQASRYNVVAKEQTDCYFVWGTVVVDVTAWELSRLYV
jgi:hypothetical protein